MDSVQRQSFFRESSDGQILTRGAYSATPLYFLNHPIGNKWLVSHSLRELGAYVNYQPSPEGIRDFLCYGFVPAPRTIFQGISAVPPNMTCCLPLADKQIDWSLAEIPTRPLLQQPENSFWQQLCTHVKRDQAAVLLSGGLDSAMIAAAAKVSGTKITSYHARFSGADVGEGTDTHAARMTAQHLGLAQKEIVVNSLDALRWFSKTVGALEQP